MASRIPPQVELSNGRPHFCRFPRNGRGGRAFESTQDRRTGRGARRRTPRTVSPRGALGLERSGSVRRATRAIDVRYAEADVGGVKRIAARTTTRIDLREQVLNFPSQPVITKDNVTIDIDAVLYYCIADPQKATYAVQNLPYALETLTRTTLRNIVGEMELDQTLASRDQINNRMREVIEEAAVSWGVDVTRVELQ